MMSNGFLWLVDQLNIAKKPFTMEFHSHRDMELIFMCSI